MLREAVAALRARKVTSLLTAILVAGTVLAIMLTSGRTIGAEQQVLSSIDDAGSRAITVRASENTGLRTDVLESVARLSGVEWAGAFTVTTDGTNTLLPGGAKAGVREVFTLHPQALGIPRNFAPTQQQTGQGAWASPAALRTLGLETAAGSITLDSGSEFAILGELTVPQYLAEMEPLVLAPRTFSAAAPLPVTQLTVVASRPELVPALTRALVSLIEVDDPSGLKISTSSQLAELRGIVQGQLGAFSRGLVLALTAVTGVLLAIVQTGMVLMRRRDFGRRRALGATRSLIIALQLTQTAVLAFCGVIAGLACSCLILLVSGDPLPGGSFMAALAVITFTVSVLAALAPAVYASKRDPLRELRVP